MPVVFGKQSALSERAESLPGQRKIVTGLSLVQSSGMECGGGVSAQPDKKLPFREQDLSRWRLIEDFQARLQATSAGPSQGTFADPKRKLHCEDYLGLLLFGLFNPVIDSMRGLCAATHLERVQEQVSRRTVSLGSFSEAQAVIDPHRLQTVFAELAAQAQPTRGDRRLESYRAQMMAIDGTIWPALPRMSWALWRWQHGREGALKAHVKLNLLEEKPVAVAITPAKTCERAVLRELWQRGEFYVGDRNYGQDYGFFRELEEAGCTYLVRLRNHAVFTVQQEYALRPEDRAASVTFDGLVHLGERGHGPVVRLIRIQTEDSELLLVTNQPQEQMEADLVALIYR